MNTFLVKDKNKKQAICISNKAVKYKGAKHKSYVNVAALMEHIHCRH